MLGLARLEVFACTDTTNLAVMEPFELRKDALVPSRFRVAIQKTCTDLIAQLKQIIRYSRDNA
jgi:hypothetical protein